MRITITAILFLISAGSGFWLHAVGRPLNTPVFTIHKLTALAMIVLAVMYTLELLKTADASAGLIVLTVLAGVAVLILLVTGGLLSFDNLVNPPLFYFHNVGALLTLLLIGTLFYKFSGW